MKREDLIEQSYETRLNRRELVVGLAFMLVTGLTWSSSHSQVPPPPPRPHNGLPPKTSLLPVSTELVNRLRSKVTIDREDALKLENVVSANFERQRNILRDFGIDPDYLIPPGFRLSSRDARELNQKLDEETATLERETAEILSLRARSEFRRIIRSASDTRRTSINSLRR